MANFPITAGEHRIHRIELDYEKRVCRFVVPIYATNEDNFATLRHLRSLPYSLFQTIYNNEDQTETFYEVANLDDIFQIIKMMNEHSDYKESIGSSSLVADVLGWSTAENSALLQELDSSDFIPFTPMYADLDGLLKTQPIEEPRPSIEWFKPLDPDYVKEERYEMEKIEDLNTQLRKALASEYDYNRILKLIEDGANPNTKLGDKTLAHYAAINNHTRLLRLLIKKGALLNEPDDSGRTPLFYAKEEKAFDILSENSASLLHRDNQNRTAISEIAESLELTPNKLLNKEINKKKNANPMIIKELIQLGAEIDLSDDTNFNLALDSNNQDLLQHIISEHVKQNNFPLYIQTYLIKNPRSEEHKILSELNTFVSTEIVRLMLESRLQKGLSDKIALYKKLQPSIFTAMANETLDKAVLKNLINQVATIAHHRRYRTCNKIAGILTLGLYTVRANSWKNFHEFVQTQKKNVANDVVKILHESLRVRTARIAVEDEPGHSSVGYEEYRKNVKR